MAEIPAADNRRDTIVQIARQILAEKGFEGFRVREVAARSGINHATLLYYFPSKEALIQAMVESIIVEFGALYSPSTDEKRASPRAELQQHFHGLLKQMQETPDVFVVMNELQLRAIRDPEIRSIVQHADKEWFHYLHSVLDLARKQQKVRPDVSSEDAARFIMVLFRGMSLRSDPPETRQRSVALLEQWLFI
ncbi:MAG: ScbR family autoregulator-binding transcription factor [Armatimonadaceae bacterium]